MDQTRSSTPVSWVQAGFVGDEYVEQEAQSADQIVSDIQRSDVWEGFAMYPVAAQFPRMHVSLHQPHGFVVQCWENEASWSDFLLAAQTLGRPSVEIQHGGQALELWPRQLFVAADVTRSALKHFLHAGTQDPALNWVRIDRFPREILWEDAAGRKAWEESRASPN